MGSIRLYKRAACTSRENNTLLPTERGRLRSLSAVEEAATGLAERFDSDPESAARADDVLDGSPDYISAEEVVEELQHQDASKACGVNGIHIRLMRSLSSTSSVPVLAALCNSCIEYGKTPRAWNDTTVCLIVKKRDRPKDADNVRPIALIGMFRKVI